MTTDAQTLVGIIDEAGYKDGESDRGDWRRWDFRIRGPAGTRRYSTFDKGWPTNLATGKTYRFTYTTKEYTNERGSGTNYTLTSATQVDPSEFGAQPSSNGEFKQPYEPPTDEAKAQRGDDVAGAHLSVGGPQPEYKSPSRSYDQGKDIDRRSIERQVALKAAIEVNSQNEVKAIADVLDYADAFFTWLREDPADVRSSPAEPIAEAQDTQEPTDTREGGWAGEVRIPIPDAESDGGPALFPPAIINSLADLQGALKKLPGVQRAGWTDKTWKAKTSAILGEPLDQIRDLQGVYDTIAHHFAEQGQV